MAERILVILGSARKQSDTLKLKELLFDSVAHDTIDLLDYTIAPYDYTHQYPEADQFPGIAAEILKYDTIVFATPVYWYAMSAHMKILFDRLTDLVRIQKTVGRQPKGKSILFISVGTDPELPPGFEVPFANTAEYLDMKYKGAIYSPEKMLGDKGYIEKLKGDLKNQLGIA
jgi:hypothetical protein